MSARAIVEAVLRRKRKRASHVHRVQWRGGNAYLCQCGKDSRAK